MLTVKNYKVINGQQTKVLTSTRETIMSTKLISIVIIMIFCNFAFAAGGSMDGGGGNSIGPQLLDLVEGEEEIDIESTQAYKDVVLPLLRSLETDLPALSDDMKAVLTKKWYFTSEPLTNLPLENAAIDSDLKQVAIQDTYEVFVYKPWFATADVRNQAALIIHEMFVNFHLQQYEYGKYRSMLPVFTSMALVRKLTRIFMQETLPNIEALQYYLEEYGVGAYVNYPYNLKYLEKAFNILCVEDNFTWSKFKEYLVEIENKHQMKTLDYFLGTITHSTPRYDADQEHMKKKFCEMGLEGWSKMIDLKQKDRGYITYKKYQN